MRELFGQEKAILKKSPEEQTPDEIRYLAIIEDANKANINIEKLKQQIIDAGGPEAVEEKFGGGYGDHIVKTKLENSDYFEKVRNWLIPVSTIALVLAGGNEASRNPEGVPSLLEALTFILGSGGMLSGVLAEIERRASKKTAMETDIKMRMVEVKE
ncbi:MAG: hypothetical protein V4439_01045 [Patescibacteria group bacterium]